MKNSSLLLDRYLFLFFILALTVFKLWLVWGLRIRVESGQGFDDALYIHLANAIINGEWLGTYNNLTLAKMPGYPLWLAFNHFLGLPLLFTQHLLYVFAGLVFIFPLRKIVTNRTILLVLYTIYLFNPAIETRVMREGIYPALSTLIFATLVGLYVYREAKLWKLFRWSLFCGLSLSMLWLTREEGVWIIPSVTLLIGYTLFELYQMLGFSKALIARILLSLMPFAILLVSIHLISSLNYTYYGVYKITEIGSKPFTSAYGALMRVKHPQWKRYLPLPEAVRQQIYQVSPAFKELEPLMESDIGKRWVPTTCIFYPDTCPDIAGSWFMWALRESVSYAGYHRSAQMADEYYQRLTNEVNTACNKGVLDCLPPRDTLTSPYRTEYNSVIISTFWTAVQRVISLPISEYVYSELAHSVAIEYGQKIFYEMTHNPVSPIITAKEPPIDPTLTTVDRYKLDTLKQLEKFYQIILLPLSYLIIPVYIFCVIISLLYRQFSFLLIFNLAILGAIIGRLIILVIIDASSFPTLFNWWSYLVPFYSLLLAFLVLSTVDTFQRCTLNPLPNS